MSVSLSALNPSLVQMTDNCVSMEMVFK